ncbi:MAG: DNA-formamidopyrimidine glycosylase family protein [Clostridia bacterium]|nr:DNA-formamidopyrimidine glycosylase family protein [Clostridia bacterium]
MLALPELPELTVMARQMREEIAGKVILSAACLQPKCLNVDPEALNMALTGKRVGEATNKGKWIFLPIEPDYALLINLGMGGDLVQYKPGEALPAKYQFKLEFTDGTGFTIRFWWFGYVHLVANADLGLHDMTRDLGPSPLDADFTLDDFRAIMRVVRGRVKTFMLDQRRLAGIGNAYAHDILFQARIHPERPIPSLTAEEIEALYASIRSVLGESIHLGGAYYEKDFYGHPGGYTAERWVIGYREGTPCPVCGTEIQKIKTGATSSFVCPTCQR